MPKLIWKYEKDKVLPWRLYRGRKLMFATAIRQRMFREYRGK